MFDCCVLVPNEMNGANRLEPCFTQPLSPLNLSLPSTSLSPQPRSPLNLSLPSTSLSPQPLSPLNLSLPSTSRQCPPSAGPREWASSSIMRARTSGDAHSRLKAACHGIVHRIDRALPRGHLSCLRWKQET